MSQPLAATYPVLQYFVYNHLPEGPLRETSKRFASLASQTAADNPTHHPETAKALDRLLEAKDAAVRSMLP